MQIEIDNDTLNNIIKGALVVVLWLINNALHQVKLIFKRLDHIRHYLLKNTDYTEENDNE